MLGRTRSRNWGLHAHTRAHARTRTHSTHNHTHSLPRPRRYPTIAALTLSGTPSVPVDLAVDGQDHSALFDDPTDVNGSTAAQYIPPPPPTITTAAVSTH